MTAPMTMTAVNLLDPAQFTRVFGNVVEHAPSIASVLARRRPFRDAQHLLKELNDIMDALPKNDKVDILRRIPDLAGRLSEEGRLSAESQREHKAGGLDKLTEQQAYDLRRLNEAYREKFGFPFVICVRENNKVSAIMEGLQGRVLHSTERELLVGLEQVKAIAKLRVLDLVISP